jgi:hypothetical protein
MKFEFTKAQIERLLETYSVKNIDKLLNENIVAKVITRFLGKKLVTKLEANYGDDAVKVLDNLFAAVESISGNIIAGADKKLYLVSASGKKWSMETIKQTIEGVASGKLPASDLALLPKTLKDGQEFRKVFENQFKYGKPKPVVPKPKSQPKQSSTNTGGAAVTILTEEQLWKYFADQMSKLNVVKRLGAQQGKLFIEEMTGEFEKMISKNGKKLEPGLDALKKQYNNIKSPSDRADLLLKIQDKILNLGKTKATTSGSQATRYEAFMNFMKSSPMESKRLKYIFIASMITSIGLDLIRAVDDDRKFEGHFGKNFGQTTAIKIGVFFVGALMKMNMIGVILNVGLAIDSLVRSIPYIWDDRKNKPGIVQRGKNTVKKGGQFIDSTAKANKPTYDSLKNIYKPKVDSVVQKLKTDYKDQSTNNQPLTGDNRPVIKY